MRPLRLLLPALALALVAGCGGASAPEAPDRQPAPKALPEATLQAFQGSGLLDLRELKGPAVINLWASYCGPCKRELPVYRDFSKQYSGKVAVIGIDFQETREGAARTLIKDSGVTYPLYADPEGVMRAIGLPKVLLVDAQGRVVFEKYAEMATTDEIADLVRDHLPGVIS